RRDQLFEPTKPSIQRVASGVGKVDGEDREEVDQTAFLDRQLSAHIGFAEPKRGIQGYPQSEHRSRQADAHMREIIVSEDVAGATAVDKREFSGMHDLAKQ